jgi:hypothetical protein
MTAVFCRNAADRKAATWKADLAPFSRLEFAVSDPAQGIAAAVEQVAAGRHGEADAGPALEHGLDVFHTTREAHRVLARHWRHAEAAWDQAEAADARVARARQQGVDARGPAGPARTAWRKATAALEQVEHRKGPGGGLMPRWSDSDLMADSTTAPPPRPRSRRRCPACPAPTGPRSATSSEIVAAWPSWTEGTAGWTRPSRGASGARRWPGVGGCATVVRRRRPR